MDGTQLTLHDLIHAPDKAEHVLEDLSSDQIALIEQTIRRVKKRKLDHQEDEDYTPTRTTRPRTARSSNTSRAEPTVEIRDGVEWVSFVYSHNRVVKRYNIRTDIQTVTLDMLDEQFKLDNCVYPRANLPKETYRGNRWSYETECNRLGWKLAWLNKTEIAGKRGLIQRAVDSYRNRSPSLRSRRVARQAKLMNGTLRKRKQELGAGDGPEGAVVAAAAAAPPTPSASEDDGDDDDADHHCTAFPTTLAAATVKSAHSPKTLVMLDAILGRFRIKINVESVALDTIPIDFRNANTVFPRATAYPVSATTTTTTTNNDDDDDDDDTKEHADKQRWIEESICNELGWKLAWLNPRFLANKKTLLQRAMDMYRQKFMPALQPRRHRSISSPAIKDLPASTNAHTSPPVMPALNNTASMTVPTACLSPSVTESSFEEFQQLSPLDLFVDSSSMIDPCLMLSSPFIPPPIPDPVSLSSHLDEAWFKLEQDDPSISHYLSSYVDLF